MHSLLMVVLVPVWFARPASPPPPRLWCSPLRSLPLSHSDLATHPLSTLLLTVRIFSFLPVSFSPSPAVPASVAGPNSSRGPRPAPSSPPGPLPLPSPPPSLSICRPWLSLHRRVSNPAPPFSSSSLLTLHLLSSRSSSVADLVPRFSSRHACASLSLPLAGAPSVVRRAESENTGGGG